MVVPISAVFGLLLGSVSWVVAAWLTAGSRIGTSVCRGDAGVVRADSPGSFAVGNDVSSLVARWLGRRATQASPVQVGVCVGGLFVLVAIRSEKGVAELAIVAILALPLLITLLTDFQARLVFPVVILPGLLLALGIAATGSLGWQAALIGGGGAAAVAALLVILSRWLWSDGAETPLGSGEILIAAMIGATLGPGLTPTVLFVGMLAGAAVAGLLLLTRRALRDDAIPYGVFLCGSALVALVMGGG